jgi:hypothetical protein
MEKRLKFLSLRVILIEKKLRVYLEDFTKTISSILKSIRDVEETIENLPLNLVSKVFTPTKDIVTGSIDTVVLRTINTSTDLTGLDLAGKVIVLEDGNIEACLILSNTATSITVDADFKNTIDEKWGWRVLHTYELTTNTNTILACYLTNADAGIVLPTVSTANDRAIYNVYLELVSNNNKAHIVTKGEDGITKQYLSKFGELNATGQIIGFASHNTPIEKHYDVVQNVGSNKHITAFTTNVFTTVATTNEQQYFLNTVVTVDNESYFRKMVDDNGFQFYEYTSLIPGKFEIEGLLNIGRSGGAASNVSFYFKKNNVQLNRITNSRFGTSDVTNVTVKDVAQFSYGDKLTCFLQRESASSIYIVDSGSSLIINQL